MKKSLIALAVLAASGASMAQSSVTLYGLVDAYVGGVTTETGPGTKLTQTVVGSSGGNSSRWGLRGTEDLGGGLKANFVLESGFNTDDGTAAGAQFGRQAFVGLSGNFGAVTLGRQYTAYFALHNATNNLADTNLNTTTGPVISVWSNNAGANGIVRHQDRTDNSIAYTSPVYSGFSGAVVLGLGENKTAALNATKNYSAHVKYANGPLLVGYAHQVENTRTAGPANSADRKYNLFAGSYNFGVAKLTGGFNMAKQGTVEDKEFQVGVSVPFGAAAVHAGYSYSKSEIGNADNGKASGVSLLGTYSLSKRTTLYAAVANGNFKNAANTTVSKTSVVAAGVRHTF